MVDESSGCLDLSDKTDKFSLSRTHFNMNKFGKPTEEDFETVGDVIKDMISASTGLILARSECIFTSCAPSRQMNVKLTDFKLGDQFPVTAQFST